VGSTKIQRVDRSIYKRGADSWQVKIGVCGAWITATFSSLAEARAYRDSKKAVLTLDPEARRVIEARTKRNEVKITLKEALDRYSVEVSSAKRSHQKELHTIRRIQASKLGGMPLYRVTPEDVDSYLKNLRRAQAGPLQGRGVSGSTKRKHAAVLSHLFTIAVKRWRMPLQNPVKQVELPSPGASRRRRLEDGEEVVLRAALAESGNLYALPLFVLAIETAARQGELLRLEWADVRLSGEFGTALLRQTKNGDERIIPLSKAAVLALGSLPRPLMGGRVFPVSAQQLRGFWEAARKACGIEDLRWHDLRHEAVSRLFEAGFDRIEAAAVSGHKTLQMLKDYTHLRAEKLALKLNAARG